MVHSYDDTLFFASTGTHRAVQCSCEMERLTSEQLPPLQLAFNHLTKRFRRGQAQVARDTVAIRTAMTTRWPGFNPSSSESDKAHVCVCSPWCVANTSIQQACSRKQTLLRLTPAPTARTYNRALVLSRKQDSGHVMGGSTCPELLPRNDSHGPTASQSCS